MGQEASYPRALVINGDALNQGMGGAGTTVANLFAGWPQDKLAQMYLNRTEAYGDAECGKTWRLDFVKDRVPGLRILKNILRVPMESPIKQIRNPRVARPRGAAITRIRGAARTTLDLIPYRLNSDLLHDIHAFAPEVIYSCIGNIQLPSLVERLSRLEGAAMVVHLMDD